MKDYKYTYHISSFFKKSIAYLALVLYCLAYVGQDFVHQLHHLNHQDSRITCTAETEKDLCHLSLVHHQPDACKHDHHFQKVKLDCSLCAFTIGSQNTIAEAVHILDTSIDRSPVYYYISTNNKKTIATYLLRGPPTEDSNLS